VDSRPLSPARRRLVLDVARSAALAPAVLGFLEGTVSALPRAEETDIAILYAALGLENEAIAVYDYGLARGLVPPGLRDYASEFRGDHMGHRDTQVAIIEERGGRPPQPLERYDFGKIKSSDDLLREALLVEVAAQDSYTALISQIASKDYLLSAAFILVDEVRHMTVWRRVLGMKIY